MGLRIERTAPLPDVVVTFENIVSICKFLQRLVDAAEAEDRLPQAGTSATKSLPKRYRTELTVTFEQDPATSISVERFKELDAELVAFAKTRSISIRYYSSFTGDGSESISVKLTEGNSTGPFSNFIGVTGNSKEWVDANFSAVSEIVKSFRAFSV